MLGLILNKVQTVPFVLVLGGKNQEQILANYVYYKSMIFAFKDVVLHLNEARLPLATPFRILTQFRMILRVQTLANSI